MKSNPLHNRTIRRAGLSLIEVIVALSIFLFAFIAVGQLINLSSDSAREISYQSDGIRIAQSTLAQVVAGILPLETVTDSSVEDESPWTYSIDCEQQSVANLWKVTVTAKRPRPGGTTVEVPLTQLVLDPSVRGGIGSSSSSSSESGTTAP
ncbi:type IV pilus modification PilV family protein [Tuwongella immobilis]|uniref:Uncharacterized protein n=1 Tax=Tuwongella immobilis TaxID=692036 RepID=A0A6C2YSV1_9BACT|nr:hypothetical protein [Tuwongella immobilis]VIP04407.1 Uncharacterized protein OS=Planctomyces maris DSM 8797 GN=PM8797T_14304 PE=4 SV=1 [Tuwongella immobilis]VTS06176.1 Uncharacterized protein OS=Planctomyces maris DSM 8797 GN=PM8797T_14304 PE=4 SV=1 [Tuwongella immobilis]